MADPILLWFDFCEFWFPHKICMNFYTEVKTDVPQHITQTPPPQLQTRLPQKNNYSMYSEEKITVSNVRWDIYQNDYKEEIIEIEIPVRRFRPLEPGPTFYK